MREEGVGLRVDHQVACVSGGSSGGSVHEAVLALLVNEHVLAWDLGFSVVFVGVGASTLVHHVLFLVTLDKA